MEVSDILRGWVFSRCWRFTLSDTRGQHEFILRVANYERLAQECYWGKKHKLLEVSPSTWRTVYFLWQMFTQLCFVPVLHLSSRVLPVCQDLSDLLLLREICGHVVLVLRVSLALAYCCVRYRLRQAAKLVFMFTFHVYWRQPQSNGDIFVWSLPQTGIVVCAVYEILTDHHALKHNFLE